jgi:AcrR family transcriptional regulator
VSTRERILEGALQCVSRVGMGKTTMEDIARQAAVSRATLYRAFPGGRDEVLESMVTWEVARFFLRVSEAIHPDELDRVAVLEQGLMAAREALEHHDLLQQLLRDEAEQIVPSLSGIMPLVQQALADWYRPRLVGAPLRPAVDPAEAADLVARLVLSYLGTPGQWDLADSRQVGRLVREHLLAAVLELPEAGRCAPKRSTPQL